MSRLVGEIFRFGLILLFTVSGLLKFYSPTDFAVQLMQYPGLSPRLISLAVWAVPALEILAALLLWYRSWLGIGLSAGLTLTFMAVVLPNWGLHFEEGCGCFGIFSGPETVGWPHLTLLLSMLLATGLVAWGKVAKPAPQRLQSPVS